jgi:hypothetical protein
VATQRLTEIQRTVLTAALVDGDAGSAQLSSRRVRSRTITELQSRGLLYSKNIDGAVGPKPAAEKLMRGLIVTHSAPLKYRGLEIWPDSPPIPQRQFDWQAYDPNSDGEMLAHGRTLDECKADVDRYFEEMSA